jgi:hypothetical protein
MSKQFHRPTVLELGRANILTLCIGERGIIIEVCMIGTTTKNLLDL